MLGCGVEQSMTRILLAADLHGSETVYSKLLNSARFYGVAHIVVAGDLTGKVLVPVVERGGEYDFDFFGSRKRVEPSKFGSYAKEIRSAGHYYKVVTKAEFDELAAGGEPLKRAFVDAMLESLRLFLAKAEERMASAGATLYLIAGNDDYPDVAQFLVNSQTGRVVEYESAPRELKHLTLAGVGYSNPTPWNSPRELSEDELWRMLDAKLRGLEPRRTVLVAHPPPFDTSIDRAPKLKGFKPVVSGGRIETEPVGSHAVRRVIELFEPAVSLHGHIHESGGVGYVVGASGRRVSAYNPGSEYTTGVLRGVLLDLGEDGSSRHLFVRG